MKILTIVTAIALFGTAAGAAPAPESTPTFTEDVAPIFYEKCVGCHRPAEAAPMSLLTYETARPWAKAVKTKVVAREMPPWFADNAHSKKMRNDRSLTQGEIETIVRWVDGGAPRGAGNPPPAPQMASGWNHPSGRDPDFVIAMPIEYDVPAEGEIPNLTLYTKIPMGEDKFADGLELRRGNPVAVHHAIVSIADLPKEAKVNDKGVLEVVRPDHGATGAVASISATRQWKLIGSTGGKGMELHAPGTGKRIPFSEALYFSFNMHYQATGRPEKDRSVLGLWFAKGPVTHEVVTKGLEDSFVFDGKPFQGPMFRALREIPPIPPYRDNFPGTATMAIKDDITLLAISPHMHLRGKDILYTVKYPDGRVEELLSVPKYDFNWQLHYELEEPIKIPAGSVVTAEAHYDNSLKNRYNPAPDRPVYWSEQSWDEMLVPFIEYTIDKQDLRKATTQAQKPE